MLLLINCLNCFAQKLIYYYFWFIGICKMSSLPDLLEGECPEITTKEVTGLAS